MMISTSHGRTGRGAVAADGPSLAPRRSMSGRAPATFALRTLGFTFLVALSVAWLWQPLRTLILLSLQSHEYEHYSHIAVVPLISFALIYLDRQSIFSTVRSGYALGAPLMVAGLGLGLLSEAFLGADSIRFTSVTLGAVTLWIGAFILCYGTAAFKGASFPLAFLFLMIP